MTGHFHDEEQIDPRIFWDQHAGCLADHSGRFTDVDPGAAESVGRVGRMVFVFKQVEKVKKSQDRQGELGI